MLRALRGLICGHDASPWRNVRTSTFRPMRILSRPPTRAFTCERGPSGRRARQVEPRVPLASTSRAQPAAFILWCIPHPGAGSSTSCSRSGDGSTFQGLQSHVAIPTAFYQEVFRAIAELTPGTAAGPCCPGRFGHRDRSARRSRFVEPGLRRRRQRAEAARWLLRDGFRRRYRPRTPHGGCAERSGLREHLVRCVLRK